MIIIRIILVLVLFLSGLLLASEKPIDVTIYAANNYPPFAYEEDGVAKGIYAQILKTAFSRIPSYNLVIESVPWKRGLKYLELGVGFALYPPYKHVDQRPYIASYTPLFEERVVVYCRSEIFDKPREKWPEDYFGLVFGMDDGFIIDERFQEAVIDEKITVNETLSTRENLLMLLSSRVDCYLNSRLSILWAIKSLKALGKYEDLLDRNVIKEGVLIKSEYSYLGVVDDKTGRFPYKEDLVGKLDSIIDKMRDDGGIEKIVSDVVSLD